MALQRKESAKIEDFGEKIGGARKDLWRERGLNFADFEHLDEREYEEYIVKKNIWIEPDFKQLVADGMSPACSYFVKYVRDAIPAKPIKLTKDLIKIYIELIEIYKEATKSLHNDEDIKSYINVALEIAADRRFEYIKSNPYYKVYRELIISESDYINILSQTVIQDFPNDFKGVLKGLGIVKYSRGDVPVYYIRQNKHYVNYSSFPTYEEALAHAQEVVVPKLVGNQENKKRITKTKTVVRPQLEGIERTGSDVRQGKDVTGEDLLHDFKFKGGEFGNWNTQGDRQACLNYAYDAFSDLSKVLRVPNDFISLGGYQDKKLSIAFGSRGKGAALAHYEPARVVINLTKMKGAGSLAHEWGHALDDFIGVKCQPTKKLMMTDMYSRYGMLYEYPEIAEAFKELMNTIMYRPATKDEEIKEKTSKSNIYKMNIDRLTSSMPNIYNGTVEQVNNIRIARDEFLNDLTENSFDKLVAKYKEETGRLPSKELRTDVTTYLHIYNKILTDVEDLKKEKNIKTAILRSDFYKGAKSLDAGKAKPYFSSEVELFARAFESYVEDELKRLGVKSDYLVHSTYNSFYDSLKPYPEGEEREIIDNKMREFLLLVANTFAEVVEEPKDEVIGEITAEQLEEERKEKGKFKLTLFKDLCNDKGLKADRSKTEAVNGTYNIEINDGYIKKVRVAVYNDIDQDNHIAVVFCNSNNIQEKYKWNKELDYNDFVTYLLGLEIAGQEKLAELEKEKRKQAEELKKKKEVEAEKARKQAEELKKKKEVEEARAKEAAKSKTIETTKAQEEPKLNIKEIKTTTDLRNALRKYVKDSNTTLKNTPNFVDMFSLIHFNQVEKYKTNIVIAEIEIGEKHLRGNSKAWAINNKDILCINLVADDKKKIEGLIEGMINVLTSNVQGAKKKKMLREGLTFMICVAYKLDVRTYVKDEDFEKLIKAGTKSKENYIEQVIAMYKEVIKYFVK